MIDCLFISIIIPCRNEEIFIGKCLGSLLEQDWPKDRMEILVVDGSSEDKTKEIIHEYSKRYPFIRLLNNPNKFTPFAFNIGVKESKGELIFLMSAHAGYKKDYISKCVKYLEEHNADNIGGIMKTLPRENTLISRAIVLALSSSFGVGNSKFRKGAVKPMWVDTVFGGCYRKEVFNKIGLFNENLIRSQDMEFNIRLKKAGGKILLHPEIISYYYPKATNLIKFFLYNIKNGIWIIYSSKFTKKTLRIRHYISFLFVLALLITGLLGIFNLYFWFIFLFILTLYFLINFYFSIKIAIKEKELKYIFIMPIAFMSRHISYGIGSFLGIIKLLKK
ncbi:MAG: glycosyltransferase family 2 protein [Candidatus Pacebacteria bacterium]|nr:glycosyltransferase family 2 protein [Candidatus Paceibacterota bacterium]